MTEQRPPDPAHGEAVGLDREIQIRTFAWFGIALVALTAVALFAMGVMFNVFAHLAKERDPAASPLPEANMPHVPPGPRLQTTPEKDLATMRAEEDARLTSYGWVDQSAGIAHIPIQRAIEILAQRAATATTDVTPAPGTAPATPETQPPAPAQPPGGGHE